jgi:hypothetical protein
VATIGLWYLGTRALGEAEAKVTTQTTAMNE